MSAKKKPPVRDWPIGTRVAWSTPPEVRIGSYGTQPAPSAAGVVSMCINGTPMVRFDLGEGREGEPVEPVTMDGAKVVNS